MRINFLFDCSGIAARQDVRSLSTVSFCIWIRFHFWMSHKILNKFVTKWNIFFVVWWFFLSLSLSLSIKFSKQKKITKSQIYKLLKAMASVSVCWTGRPPHFKTSPNELHSYFSAIFFPSARLEQKTILVIFCHPISIPFLMLSKSMQANIPVHIWANEIRPNIITQIYLFGKFRGPTLHMAV